MGTTQLASLTSVGRPLSQTPLSNKGMEPRCTLKPSWARNAGNAGKTYAEQIKPFNFLLTAHVIPFGYPEGVDPETFHLITPYDSDPRKWREKEWIDQHSKRRFRIVT